MRVIKVQVEIDPPANDELYVVFKRSDYNASLWTKDVYLNTATPQWDVPAAMRISYSILGSRDSSRRLKGRRRTQALTHSVGPSMNYVNDATNNAPNVNAWGGGDGGLPGSKLPREAQDAHAQGMHPPSSGSVSSYSSAFFSSMLTDIFPPTLSISM